MKPFILSLAMVFAFGTSLHAEEPYYCVESNNVGLDVTDDVYAVKIFTPIRFTLRLEPSQLITVRPDGFKLTFECINTPMMDARFCQDPLLGHTLNFNTYTGRFSMAKTFGFMFDNADSVSVSIGTCAKF